MTEGRRDSGQRAGAARNRGRRRHGPGVLVLCGLLAAGAGALAQAGPDAVVGTDRLMLRRGPGTDFPALDALRAGTRVEIEDIEGEWVRVITPDGRRGYVHGNFLQIPGDAPAGAAGEAAQAAPAAGERAAEAVAAPTPRPTPAATQAAERRRRSPSPTATTRRRATATPTRTPVRTPTPRSPQADELDALRARTARLEEELRAATEALAAAQRSGPPPGTPSPAPEVSAELARLAATIEALQQRLAERDDEARAGIATTGDGGAREGPDGATVGAGVLGLAAGWIIGLVLGRRGERGRRSRIRF